MAPPDFDETTVDPSMEIGVLAFAGMFGLAAVFAVWNLAHRRSIARQLEDRGFHTCDSEAGLLERNWRTATGAGAPEELKIVNCRRRSAGRGYLYHFTVRERRNGGDSDSDSPGASYPAYLLDLRDASWVGKPAVTLHLLPSGSTWLRKLLVTAAKMADERPQLALGSHPWSTSIAAAHGDVTGTLDQAMPAAMQQQAAKAGEHGFFTIHIGGGKAAFSANPAHRDIDAQMAYLNTWI
jgi:hypothetical protein